MNKIVSSIVPAKSTKSTTATATGPRVFTATEIAFVALATMIAAGEVKQKDVTGPRSKTFLKLDSWRINAACDYVTGKDATKRSPKTEGRELAKSKYWLAFAEDMLVTYGDVLTTLRGEKFVTKARTALEALAKAA